MPKILTSPTKNAREVVNPMQLACRFLILDGKVFENVLILQKMFLY